MSNIASIITPAKTKNIPAYSCFVSFSFKNILDNNIDNTQYEPTIGAAIVASFAIAYT